MTVDSNLDHLAEGVFCLSGFSAVKLLHPLLFSCHASWKEVTMNNQWKFISCSRNCPKWIFLMAIVFFLSVIQRPSILLFC